MTKISLTRLKKPWTPPVPISLIMVLFLQYITFKIWVIFTVVTIENVYEFIDLWGLRANTFDSPITLIFFSYILLVGYIFVEAKSDWPLFPRVRNLWIYGITLIIALQGLIGLDIIRRFSPYNPDQNNHTHFLRNAILNNDLEEVKRLIGTGYDPFRFSYGNIYIYDEYAKIFQFPWYDRKEWRKTVDRDLNQVFGHSTVFRYASVSGLLDKRRWLYWGRTDYLHPHYQETFLPFDERIFDYLLSLHPPREQLQQALSELAWPGHTKALIKILDYDKTLTPDIRDISGLLYACHVDVTELLLTRMFENSTDPGATMRALHEKFDPLQSQFQPCNVPIQKILSSGIGAIEIRSPKKTN